MYYIRVNKRPRFGNVRYTFSFIKEIKT